ncbi:hypothetical protein RB595_005997 [Gaeumannomyces hyphopodioides]
MPSHIPLILLALASVVTAESCRADNCLRAVRATQFPTRLNDCATGLAITVTPSASTITVTAHVTTTVVPVLRRRAVLDTDLRNPRLAERAAHPDADVKVLVERNTNTPIPAYATACADFAAYSSACFCAGATRATVTAAAPVTSTITTVTATTTATPLVFQGCRNVRANAGTFEANFNRGWTYVTEGDFPYSDAGLDACCDLCVSKGNCLVFGIRVPSAGGLGGRACEMFLGTSGEDLPGVSPACPFGAVNGQVVGYGHSLDHIAQGPCFGMPPRNEWVLR